MSGLVEGAAPARHVKGMYFPFPIYMMTEDELREAREVLRALDEAQLLQMFGPEGARRYRRVVRDGDSFDWGVARAAWAERDRMEGSLTPAQQDVFFGVGETGIVDTDEVREYLRAVADFDGMSAAELGASLKYAFMRLGGVSDFSSMEGGRLVAYAQARAGLLCARGLGWDLRLVLAGAHEAILATFADRDDGEFMCRELLAELGRDEGAALVEWLTTPVRFVMPEAVGCAGVSS